MDKRDNYQLCLAIRDQDEVAFNELLRRFTPLIENITKEFFFPNAEKEDVRQIARLALWEAAQTFNYTPKLYKKGHNINNGFAAFANMVIRRKVISELRKETRQKRQSNFGTADISTIQEPEVDIPLEEDWQSVNWFLDLLTLLERAVTYLWMQGYDYEEIAQLVGGTRRTVDNALQRSRRKARQNPISREPRTPSCDAVLH